MSEGERVSGSGSTRIHGELCVCVVCCVFVCVSVCVCKKYKVHAS